MKNFNHSNGRLTDQRGVELPAGKPIIKKKKRTKEKKEAAYLQNQRGKCPSVSGSITVLGFGSKVPPARPPEGGKSLVGRKPT